MGDVPEQSGAAGYLAAALGAGPLVVARAPLPGVSGSGGCLRRLCPAAPPQVVVPMTGRRRRFFLTAWSGSILFFGRGRAPLCLPSAPPSLPVPLGLRGRPSSRVVVVLMGCRSFVAAPDASFFVRTLPPSVFLVLRWVSDVGTLVDFLAGFLPRRVCSEQEDSFGVRGLLWPLLGRLLCGERPRGEPRRCVFAWQCPRAPSSSGQLIVVALVWLLRAGTGRSRPVRIYRLSFVVYLCLYGLRLPLRGLRGEAF